MKYLTLPSLISIRIPPTIFYTFPTIIVGRVCQDDLSPLGQAFDEQAPGEREERKKFLQAKRVGRIFFLSRSSARFAKCFCGLTGSLFSALSRVFLMY